jgi:diacylglycerol O-acyltransferase / wax synthase
MTVNKRLSPLDASFLAVETPTAHMHVGWAAVFEPPDDGMRPSFEQLREHIARRLPRAPRYRQLLKPVPFGINAPVWVDDLDFDVSRHVVATESDRLGDVVEECMSRPLPRQRPLWQVWIADRLDDGRIGVVGKAHHCMVDGIAAVELGSLLLDPDPATPQPAPDAWAPESPPSGSRLLGRGLTDLARSQLDLAAIPARAARSPRQALELASRARRAAAALLDAARPARPTPQLNPPISPLRQLGLLARPMDDLTRIKHTFGVKLNDVLLAASAGGVRAFLKKHGEVPIRLKTMVPVNVRRSDEADQLGNRISFMFVDLPCDEPDPVRRLREIHAATSDRKRAGKPEGADDVVRSLGFAPSPLQRVVSRLIASPRTFNLTVSNIPGPPEPLYMHGCSLVEAYPVVPIPERHALSIGVTTVGDGAFFGLYADPESLPEVDGLAGEIDLAIDELAELSPAVKERREREPILA